MSSGAWPKPETILAPVPWRHGLPVVLASSSQYTHPPEYRRTLMNIRAIATSTLETSVSRALTISVIKTIVEVMRTLLLSSGYPILIA